MSPTRSHRLALAGAVAQRPGAAGHTWVFLQYLLGFRRLGFDVLLIDRLPAAQVGGLAYLRDVLARFGLADSYSVLFDDGTTAGRSRAEVLEHARTSVALINVMGYLDDPEILGAAARRVFLDIDPGFGQMWRALGLADVFAGHDLFVSVGERLGSPDCAIPTCGLDWITTPQPVVLEHWPVAEGPGEVFTSVGAWRGPYGPIEYEGRTYGLRAHEFRRFLGLPAATGQTFEMALDIDEADQADLTRLQAGGWRLRDPAVVAATPELYREYLGRSRAELMIAKNLYVDTRSGWFSDRSICYLACGRPVLAQETGFSERYPVGEGLLAFSDPEGAAAAVEAVVAAPVRHRRAAREIAEAYFAAEVVLPRLLDRLGAG